MPSPTMIPTPPAPAGGPERLAHLTHPPLVIRARDERPLHEIAIGAMLSAPRLAGGLLDELNRAAVRPDREVAADVIGLGSRALCFESDGARSQYHRVEIVTPEDYLGDVMGDVSRRRGILQGQDDSPSGKVINAMVPLGEMFGYATTLRSMSQGRATFSMEFDHYAEAPANIADAVVKKN